jgi:hypothetical protein
MMHDIKFRSPLEKKWARIFDNLNWVWSYSYTKGSPPEFFIYLVTDPDTKVFVTACHGFSHSPSRLNTHIRKIRNLKLFDESIPILAVSDRPFINYELSPPSDEVYTGLKEWLTPNCIGRMNFKCSDGVTHSGPAMIKDSPGRHASILYWFDEDNWEYSSLNKVAKPEGWYGKYSRISWQDHGYWTPLYLVGAPEKEQNEKIHKIVDAYLYKPPNGFMFLKGIRDLMEMGIVFADDNFAYRTKRSV